jgi:hypothetical protein
LTQDFIIAVLREGFETFGAPDDGLVWHICSAHYHGTG